MTEFDYDVRERRALVSSARHKKNGIKSRKCSLSTDYMTRKEWEKLNGEVASLNFSKPHDRQELSRLPVTLQRDYIKSLVERFNVSTRMLSEMLGCQQGTVYRYVDSIGLGDMFHDKHKLRPTAVQRLDWDMFIKGISKIEDNIVTAEASEPEAEPEVQDAPEPEIHKMLSPVDASLVYEGRLEDVCKALVFAIGPDTVGRFHVVFDRMEAEDDA